jgi:hypothetical protein
MALRSFGGAAGEARRNGATYEEQVGYGAASAALEFATEKLFGGDAGVYGKGLLDNVSQKILGKLQSTPAGKAALNVLGQMGQEGAEEALASVVTPLLQGIYNDKSLGENWDEVKAADVLYDALIGAVLGGAGAVVSGNKPTTGEEAMLRGTADGTPSVAVKQPTAPVTSAQASESANNAPSIEGGEITPDVSQNVENASPVELNNAVKQTNKPIKDGTVVKALDRGNFGYVQGYNSDTNTYSVRFTSKDGLTRVIDMPANMVQATNAKNVREARKKAGRPELEVPQVREARTAKPSTQKVPPSDRTVTTESKYLESLLNEDERQIEGLTEEDFTHEQRHDAVVGAEADQRIATDGTAKVQADLTSKPADQWNDTDVVVAQKVLASEVENARNLTGEDAVKAYAEIAKLAKAYRDSGTEQGRAMRQRRGFDNSVEGITAAATEALFGDKVKTRKGITDEKKVEIAKQVADLATRYNNIAQGDVDSIVNMIKEVSGIRKTNGLFAKETSRTMNWALDVAKNFPDGEQFLSEVLATQIKSVAGDYVAPDITNSIKSYRFMSMLSKISTVARNLVSNGVLDGMEMFSNNISVPLDMLLSTFTGTRSTTFEGGVLTSGAKRKGTTEGMIRSMIQVGLDADITDAPSKYDQTAGRNFKMTGNALERLLSTWEKYENYALKTADEAAKGGIKAEKQRGIDALLEAGKIQKGALTNRAENVALERTLQSDTAASKVALGLRNAGNVVHVGNIGLGDLAMPYAKVPANAVSMSAAYLPSGAIPTAKRLVGVLSAAKNGTLTAEQQAQFVQSFGRTLTGAGLTFASAALAAAGIIKSVDDDDKDKAAAEKAAGQSGTQINLSAFNRWINGESTEWQAGDNLMSIAFLQPINANLMMGMAIAEAYKDDEINVRKIAGANAEALADSVLEFPAVSQISNMVNNYKYSEGEDALAKGADAAMGFAGDIAGSFVPNALRGIAAGTDPYIRDVYSGETTAQQTIDNIKSGIPGLRETLPVATDSWGNPKMQMASPTVNFLNQNILPGAINTYQPNAMMPELERLTEAGITGLYPNRNAPNKIEDFELTYEEKQKYLQTANAMQSTMYNEAKESGFYDALTDEQKGEWLKDIQQFAEGVADNEYLASKGEKGEDNWDAIAALSDPVYYLGAKNAYSDATDKKNAEPNYAALDAFMSYLPNLDGYTRDMLDEQNGFKVLRCASDVYGMDSGTAITNRNMISETQKTSLGGKDGGSADMAAIAKNVKGSDADKLAALEVANTPDAKTGKRQAIVRRTEAAMAQGIPFDDWAKIETYITDAGSTSRATIMAAGEKYGYKGYEVYNIYKKVSADDEAVTQVNDYFSKDYIAPDKVSLSEYLTGEEVDETDKASSGGGYGGGYRRSYSKSSGAKAKNLGNSVGAVKSIANSGTTSNSSKYMRQALNDVISQNKKQQATQPTVKWEDLLAGYVKGIK